MNLSFTDTIVRTKVLTSSLKELNRILEKNEFKTYGLNQAF